MKQALETRLVALYLDNKMYSDSLALIATLLKELKKLDDKMVLVEVQLLESRVCHALRNLPKAKAWMAVHAICLVALTFTASISLTPASIIVVVHDD